MDLDDVLLQPENLSSEKISLLVHRVRSAEMQLAASQRREEELAALVAERNTALDFLQGHVNELRLQLALAGIGVDMRPTPQHQLPQSVEEGSAAAAAAARLHHQYSPQQQRQLDDDEDDPACQELYQNLLGLCVSGDRAEQVVGRPRRASIGRLAGMSQQGAGHEQQQRQQQQMQQSATGSPILIGDDAQKIIGSGGSPGIRAAPRVITLQQQQQHPLSSRTGPITPPRQLLTGDGEESRGFPPPPCNFVLSGSSVSAHTTPRLDRVIIGGMGPGAAAAAVTSAQQHISKRSVPAPPPFSAAAAQAAPRERGAREFKRHRSEDEDVGNSKTS